MLICLVQRVAKGFNQEGFISNAPQFVSKGHIFKFKDFYLIRHQDKQEMLLVLLFFSLYDFKL